jgi:hypothetical protein
MYARLRIAFFALLLVFNYANADGNPDPAFIGLMYIGGFIGLYFGLRRLSQLSVSHFRIWPWVLALLLLCVSAYTAHKVLQTQSDYDECRQGQLGAGNGDYFFAPRHTGEMCSTEAIARTLHPNNH